MPLFLEHLFEIAYVGAEILPDVAYFGGVARAFHHEPSAPSHPVECLLDAGHVEGGVAVEGDSVGVGGMYLAYAVLAEGAELADDVVVIVERGLEGVVYLHGGRVDLLEIGRAHV